ncbi:MAG: hypothetical protein LBO78_02605, partial [Rickettsiales bacterium]|nr:hypothetical protein [Rickettsiales bacterium]
MRADAEFKAGEAFGRRLPFLMRRSRIIAAVKDFFAREGFAEVDTPVLQISPGMEVHLDAF